jgi:ribose transport system ATP-binding protein
MVVPPSAREMLGGMALQASAMGLAPDRSRQPVLSFHGMTKRFGGTLAADGIDLDLFPGEILALLGENGAGKSTLIKMLAGVYPPDAGHMRRNGQPYDPRKDASIAFIHQDLGLIDWMTVAENMAMAQGFPRRFGLIDWQAVEQRAQDSLALVVDGIEPGQRVQDLSRTEKSLVAIARALGAKADVLVLDEPTASLPQDEVETLFAVLRSLKARGVAMIYVSHRLDEVYAIADRLAVLRDGRLVAVQETAATAPGDLVRMIIGRAPEAVFVRPSRQAGEALLRFEDVVAGPLGPLDFAIEAGEIVGLAGLRGAGQEAVGRLLYGLLPLDRGAIRLDGEPLDLASPHGAISRGICFVAGDRNADSIAPGLSVRENMFLNPCASGRSPLAWRAPADEAEETLRLGARVDLQPNDPSAPIETLSGGNQQKMVLARWLRIGGRVLALEDPTAGVDVGAKAEIYRLLADAVGRGLAVILISTDLEEVAEICHRALVFRDGRIVGALQGADLTMEQLIHVASLTPEAAELDEPCSP